MLMRDLQPILSYTVDEAMVYAPAGCVDHQKYAALLDWYKSPITVDEANEFEGVLEASLELRSVVTKALEDAAPPAPSPRASRSASRRSFPPKCMRC